MGFTSIASYNCKGFKARNYPFIQDLFKKCTFLCIQEHWLYKCEFNNISKVIPKSAHHAVSSMQDDEFVRGRPYGGTAIIYRANIDAIVTPV